MKTKLITVVLGATLAVSGAAWSAPLVMPNTLTTEGLPADANANFDATVGAVNDNNSRLSILEEAELSDAAEISVHHYQIAALEAVPAPVNPLMVRAAGLDIAGFISLSPVGDIMMVSDTGYLAIINGLLGVPAASSWLYYETTDCTGLAVTQAYQNNSGFFAQQGMMIAGAVGGSSYGLPYYIPAGSESVVNALTIQSYGSVGDCRAGSIPIGDEIIYVYPNDEVVTGISDVTFDLPITLGR